MKVILLDDERLALDYLERQLKKVAELEVVGKYSDPLKGKGHIEREDVDVVFLDINLPEISGIELAEQLLNVKPELDIVFVTAYDHYAVKAFELNAIDYVVKPVGVDRLARTIQRLNKRAEQKTERSQKGSTAQASMRMNVLRHMSVELDRQVLTLQWRTTKAQELFLYLLQHRGQFVRKSELIDLLWPEYEPSKVYAQLYTAVYHIRKTLEPFGKRVQIANTTDGYMMQLQDVTLDKDEWEAGLQSGPSMTIDTVETYRKMLDGYAGDYLEEFDYWWAESERWRLKRIWLRTAYQVAELYQTHEQPEQAVEIYLHICKRQPYEEDAHFSLMQLYASMRNQGAVQRQYKTLESELQEGLNERPAPAITQWYRQWMQEQN